MSERYTMDAQDYYDGDRPIRDTDILNRLNEQDEDLKVSQELRNGAFELLGQVLYFLETYHNQPIGAQNQQAAKLSAKIRRLAGLK